MRAMKLPPASVSVAALFAGALGALGAANAQEITTIEGAGPVESTTEEAPARRLGSVIVSAERRDSNILETPISVTAFDADTRDLLGVLNANDIADYTPGMTYQNTPNRITIRGIGRLDNAQGSDPGVATYVDGAYTSETAFLNVSQAFVERVEVLRGPQGTLFGRNSIGGLVNVITLRPEFESSQELRLRAGSNETYNLAYTTTGAVFGSDKTAYRLNVARDVIQQGRYSNAFQGISDISREADLSSVELQVSHDFNERLSVWGKYFTSFTAWRPDVDRRVEAYDYRSPQAGQPALGYFGGLYPNPLYGLNEINPSVADPLARNVDYTGKLRVDDVHLFTWEAEYEADFADIKYIGSHQNYDFDFWLDYDGTSRASHTLSSFDPSVQDPNGTVTSTFVLNYVGDSKRWESHEFQMISNDVASPVQWIGGLYYYKERANQPFDIYLPQAQAAGTPNIYSFTDTTGGCVFGFAPDFICGLGGTPGEANPRNIVYHQNGRLYAKSYAAYGQVDWDLSDSLSAKLGLRYTKDEKLGVEEQSIYAYNPFGAFGAGIILPGTAGTPNPTPDAWIQLTPNNNMRDLKNDWGAWSGTAGLNWEWQQDALLYASYTRGYKSGGMRLGQLTPDNPLTPGDERFVDEELVDAFEVGSKQLIFDGDLQVSAAAFYYNYENLQVPVDILISGIVQQLFVNVPESESIGLELETLWQPTDNMRFGLNYSYLDTSITNMPAIINTAIIDDPATPGVNEAQVSVVGNSLPRAPRNSATLFGAYTHDLSRGGDVTFVADLVYTDSQHNTLFDDPIFTIASHEVANARIVWNNAGGDWTIIGAVRNIFDDHSPNSVTASAPELGISRLEQYVPQRAFSVEIQKRF